LSTTSCLILDVRLPSVSGLEFQSELTKANAEIPIIFITGHGDIPMTVKAMKAGAVEFLTKPFRDQDLLDAIQVALERAPVKRRKGQGCFRPEEKFFDFDAARTGGHGRRILLLLQLSTMTSHSAMRARTEWPSDYRANSSFDEIAAAYCSPKAQEYADTG
jgi:DNA-binding response OmpR family regulator